MANQKITQDTFFEMQGDASNKANKYWAIRQYDKCTSGKDNSPAAAWDWKFIIDYAKSFEFKADLYRQSGYAEQSWIAIMQGKTPWGAASNVSSCEVTRKATDNVFSTSPGWLYFPKPADKHWYLSAAMAWFTDLKPTFADVRARGLVNLWFRDTVSTNQYLVMDLAMINLKKGTGTDWVGESFTVGGSYYGPTQGVPYQVSTSGTTKIAHYNVVITSNPSSGSWVTAFNMDIDSYVTSAIGYDWAGNNPGKGWVNHSNRSQWELWTAELDVEIDDDSHNTTGQVGKCRMATKMFQVEYTI